MENIKNNKNNTMNNSNSDNSKDTINVAGPSPKFIGESGSLLYQRAARNLREYHGVPSMTAGTLAKIMTLLELRPGRLVVQGLVSEKLLEGETKMSDDILDTSSSSGSSEFEQEHEDVLSSTSSISTSSSTSSDKELRNQDDGYTKVPKEDSSKRPIHAALIAAGIKLRPRETRPLLRALGVRPRRLVKLGLVQREAILRSPRRPGGRGRGGSAHQQHGHQQQHGWTRGRGHHGRGMGSPHGSPRHAPPPHGRHGRNRRHGRHDRNGPPARGRFHGAGHHDGHPGRQHGVDEPEHEEMIVMHLFPDVRQGPRQHVRSNKHGLIGPPPGGRMHRQHPHPHRGRGMSWAHGFFPRYAVGAWVGLTSFLGMSPHRRTVTATAGHGRPSAHRRHRRSSSPVHGPPPRLFHGARHHGHHHPSSGESEGEEGPIIIICPPPCHGGGHRGGPLRPHGRPSHGRRSPGGGMLPDHGRGDYHHHGHPAGEDIPSSSGSEGEEGVGIRRESRRHFGPRGHHGGGKRRLRNRNHTSDGGHGIGVSHERPTSGPPNGVDGHRGHRRAPSHLGRSHRRRHPHHGRIPSGYGSDTHRYFEPPGRLFHGEDDDIKGHHHEQYWRMAAYPAHFHPRHLPSTPPAY